MPVDWSLDEVRFSAPPRRPTEAVMGPPVLFLWALVLALLGGWLVRSPMPPPP